MDHSVLEHRTMSYYPKSTWVLWLGILSGSLLIGALFIQLGGQFKLTMVVLLGITMFFVALVRPLWSFYSLLALALCIEQFPTRNSWTAGYGYHTNFNHLSPAFSSISMNPLELHLSFTIIGTLLYLFTSSDARRRVSAWWPMLLYAGAIIVAVIQGLSHGGDFLIALWEVRGIFYLFAIALILPQLVRTESQLKNVVWVLIGCLSFRAIEVVYLYWQAGWTIEYGGWGNHEDPGYIATFFIFFAILWFLKVRSTQRMILTWLLIPFILAFIASDRRTVYAVLATGIILFFLMTSGEEQKRILKYAWKLAIVFVVYLIMFWNSGSTIGSPARTIRESFSPDEKTESDAYTSSLYRKVEDYNLSQMVSDNPILGVGFGTQLKFYMPLPITFLLGFWVPHNQILGTVAKSGILGIACFFLFYFSVLSEIAGGYRRSNDPYFKAVLVLASAAIVNHIVYSFFDIQLIYYRNNVFVGTLIGLSSVIFAFTKDKSSDSKTETRMPLHWVVYDETRHVSAEEGIR